MKTTTKTQKILMILIGAFLLIGIKNEYQDYKNNKRMEVQIEDEVHSNIIKNYISKIK